jgi:large subunit ribosomal protein L15
MPIQRRLPKRGFTNVFAKKKYAVINVRDLSRFEAGSTVDEAELIRCKMVRGGHDGIKLLGQGDIGVSLTVKVDKVTDGAKKKIEAAGGTVEVSGS